MFGNNNNNNYHYYFITSRSLTISDWVKNSLDDCAVGFDFPGFGGHLKSLKVVRTRLKINREGRKLCEREREKTMLDNISYKRSD